MYQAVRGEACTKQLPYDQKSLWWPYEHQPESPPEGESIGIPAGPPTRPLWASPHDSLVVCQQCPRVEKGVDHQAVPAISDPIKERYSRVDAGEHGCSSEGLSPLHDPPPRQGRPDQRWERRSFSGGNVSFLSARHDPAQAVNQE